MITLVVLFSSLLVNFATVFPINAYNEYNVNSIDLVETMLNNIENLHNYSDIDPKYCIVKRRNNSTYPYALFFPKELVDSSANSTGSVNNRNDNSVTFGTYDWLYFQMKSDGTITNSALNTGSVGVLYFDSNNSSGGIIYVGSQYSMPYNGSDTFIFTQPLPTKQEHASGFSSLLEETEDGIYTVFGHSNGNITNENTFLPGSVSSNLSDRLLTAIGFLLSGINDSISYGFGVLIDILYILPGVLEDIQDYITWLTTIPTPSAVWTSLTNQGYFGMIVEEVVVTGHSIYNNNTLDVAADDFYIDFNFSGCTLPGFSGRYLFHASDWFDPIKDRYQNFLLTLVYGFVAFRFLRGLPNLIQGLSATFHKGGDLS